MAIRTSKDQLFRKPVPPRDDLLSAVGFLETIPRPPPADTQTYERNSPTSRLETNPTGKDQTSEIHQLLHKHHTDNIHRLLHQRSGCIGNGKSLPTALPTIKSRLFRRSTQ
jgi:hypothetical protein